MDRDWRSPYKTDILTLSDNGVMMNHRFISTSFDFDSKVVTINTEVRGNGLYDKWYLRLPSFKTTRSKRPFTTVH